jgi:hypothetical protein
VNLVLPALDAAVTVLAAALLFLGVQAWRKNRTRNLLYVCVGFGALLARDVTVSALRLAESDVDAIEIVDRSMEGVALATLFLGFVHPAEAPRLNRRALASPFRRP